MSTRKRNNEYDALTEAWILIKVLLKMSPKGDYCIILQK